MTELNVVMTYVTPLSVAVVSAKRVLRVAVMTTIDALSIVVILCQAVNMRPKLMVLVAVEVCVAKLVASQESAIL
jgi:hypothetical protein